VPTVALAPAIARWLSVVPGGAGSAGHSVELAGGTVRELLDALFAVYPGLRGYVLDEHGALRHHVVAFVDGDAVPDKDRLATPVPPGGEVYLSQALSGG
jgi:molybdopterin synthase sulfur carrier subunit